MLSMRATGTTSRVATIPSLSNLFDKDLARIEDVYQTEYLARQQRPNWLAAIKEVGGGP
ncbi:MAG: hypothetical protein K8U57_06905 [Planctomycetes bacterium]|nr:hypothetical protein [Planctomycetota bacterium]